MTKRVRVILNPNAGGGAALRTVSAIGEALVRHGLAHEIVLTRARGHATELARAAAADGVEIIAVAGGDGTLNEVAQAYVGQAGVPVRGPELALIPCGTRGDFRRTLGIEAAGTDLVEDAVARIRDGSARPVDLGVLRSVGAPGEELFRAFINVASFGIGGQVDAIASTSPKWMGGRASLVMAAVRAMASYKNASVRIKVDGAAFYEGRVYNVAIANGRFFGGGMMIAPHADPSDGRLEVVAMCDLTRAEVLGLASKIYRGVHLDAAGVRSTSGKVIEAELVHPWASVLIDIDGEQAGKLPLRATVAKGALSFRV